VRIFGPTARATSAYSRFTARAQTHTCRRFDMRSASVRAWGWRENGMPRSRTRVSAHFTAALVHAVASLALWAVGRMAVAIARTAAIGRIGRGCAPAVGVGVGVDGGQAPRHGWVRVPAYLAAAPRKAVVRTTAWAPCFLCACTRRKRRPI